MTDSTNLRIKQVGDEGAPHGTLAVADRQTAGRRDGARADVGVPLRAAVYICLSCCALRSHRIKRPCSRLSWRSAWRKGSGSACHRPNVLHFQIKWPNDIIINGKKLAGILTEMSKPDRLYQSCDHRRWYQCEYNRISGRNRAGRATSLRIEYGHTVKRAPLIAAVMERLEDNYEDIPGDRRPVPV